MIENPHILTVKSVCGLSFIAVGPALEWTRFTVNLVPWVESLHIMPRYIMWCHFLSRYFISRNFCPTMCDILSCCCMWCNAVSCRFITLCDVMWCDVMWCEVMWCDVMRCDVMWVGQERVFRLLHLLSSSHSLYIWLLNHCSFFLPNRNFALYPIQSVYCNHIDWRTDSQILPSHSHFSNSVNSV